MAEQGTSPFRAIELVYLPRDNATQSNKTTDVEARVRLGRDGAGDATQTGRRRGTSPRTH